MSSSVPVAHNAGPVVGKPSSGPFTAPGGTKVPPSTSSLELGWCRIAHFLCSSSPYIVHSRRTTRPFSRLCCPSRSLHHRVYPLHDTHLRPSRDITVTGINKGTEKKGNAETTSLYAYVYWACSLLLRYYPRKPMTASTQARQHNCASGRTGPASPAQYSSALKTRSKRDRLCCNRLASFERYSVASLSSPTLHLVPTTACPSVVSLTSKTVASTVAKLHLTAVPFRTGATSRYFSIQPRPRSHIHRSSLS